MSDLQNLYDDVFHAHIQNLRGNYVDLEVILDKIQELDGDIVVPDQPKEPEVPEAPEPEAPLDPQPTTEVAPAQEPEPADPEAEVPAQPSDPEPEAPTEDDAPASPRYRR